MILAIGTYTEMLSPNFGGHGEGILLYSFDPQQGSLKHISTTESRNPSYLAYNKNRRMLYSVEEVSAGSEGMLNAWRINHDHSLSLVGRQLISGGLACHVAMIGDSFIGVACYEDGVVLLYPIKEDGNLGMCVDMHKHRGSSTNPERQEGPHAHQIYPVSEKHFYVCDLGIDKVMKYEINKSKMICEKGIPIPNGNGPRHLVKHPTEDLLFVMNELNVKVSMLFQDELYKDFPTLENSKSGSAIRIHPNGKYIYAGNRGSGLISLCRYEHKEKNLEVIEHFPCAGETPREFQLTPDGSWLLVAYQDSDQIEIFAIDPFTGRLSKHKIYKIKSPVCLQFLT